MNYATAQRQANGKWMNVLTALGVSSKYLSGKHTPCPICAGKDRFRFDDKDGRGTFICSNCGAGDGFNFVSKYFRVDLANAKEKVVSVLPNIKPDEKVKVKADPEKIRRNAISFWRSTKVVSAYTPVGKYLMRRCGLFMPFDVIREGYGVIHPEDHKPYNVMASKISAPSGEGISIHQTYVTIDGQKAPVENSKRMLAGSLPAGSAIRLGEPSERMGVAEGIETAISASLVANMPVWSCISAPILKGFEPPEICKSLTIFADNDKNFVGQAAAYELARRISMSYKIHVEVRVPEIVGDWNDVLMG
jgi:putative DNA primase/helicase